MIRSLNDILSDVTLTLQCQLCHNSFTHSILTLPCQHHFCYECINQWHQKLNVNQCPVTDCKQPFWSSQITKTNCNAQLKNIAESFAAIQQTLNETMTTIPKE